MRRHRWTVSIVAVYATLSAGASAAGTSKAERVVDGVWLVQDDAGVWGGPSMGMTHQRGPDYQALKVLDLSGVPEADWQQTTRVRLSAFFCVRDYSWHDAKQKNGLDEFLEFEFSWLDEQGKPVSPPVKARGQEADVVREGGDAVVRCFLPRDESACLIRRPKGS